MKQFYDELWERDSNGMDMMRAALTCYGFGLVCVEFDAIFYFSVLNFDLI